LRPAQCTLTSTGAIGSLRSPQQSATWNKATPEGRSSWARREIRPWSALIPRPQPTAGSGGPGTNLKDGGTSNRSRLADQRQLWACRRGLRRGGTASLLRLRCRHPLRLAGADRLVDHLPDHEKLPSYRVGQRLKHREPVACNHCFYEPGTEPGTEQGSQQDEITAISVECKRSHLTRALGRVCARRTSHSSPSRRHGRQLTPRSKRSGERSRYGAAEKARLRSNLRTRLSEASTSRNLRLHLRQDAECDQDER